MWQMSKEKNATKIIGWGRLVFALIFFFNPDIGIIDLLPDFIGYILLCSAIAKLSDIDDRVSEAHVLLTKMVYVSLAKFASLFLVYGLIPLTDRAVTVLIISFVYSSLEFFFLLPAVFKLFEGILYLAFRNGGEAAYTPAKRVRSKVSGSTRKAKVLASTRTEKPSKTRSEKMRASTVAFIIFHAAMRTLPEFATLSAHGYSDSFSGQLYKYLDLFRSTAAIFATIAGVIWLVRALNYLKLLKGDRVWLNNLDNKYKNEIETLTDRPARRAVKTAFGFFGAAGIISLDMSFDNINILPDFFAAIALLAGLILLRKYIKGWRVTTFVASVYAVVTACGTVARTWFDNKFFAEAIMTDEKVYNAHILVCTVTAVEALLFGLTITLLLFVIIKNIIVRHTGFSMTSNDSYNPSEKIRLLHIELSKKLWPPAILGWIVAVCCFLTRLFVNGRYIVSSLVNESSWMSFLYEALIMSFWQVEFIFTGIFAVALINLLRNINEQIEYKYMLD